MKCVSLRQPWAWLVMNGYVNHCPYVKDNRYRGRVALYVSKRMDMDCYNLWSSSYLTTFPSLEELEAQRLGFVGSVAFTDSVRFNEMWYLKRPYARTYTDPVPIEFTPFTREDAGVADVPRHVVRAIKASLKNG